MFVYDLADPFNVFGELQRAVETFGGVGVDSYDSAEVGACRYQAWVDCLFPRILGGADDHRFRFVEVFTGQGAFGDAGYQIGHHGGLADALTASDK